MSNIKKAYEELEAIGAPVLESDGYNCEFRISGEVNDDIIWADYYHEYQLSTLDDFGVNKEVVEILDKHNLYAEWANAGVLHIYKV